MRTRSTLSKPRGRGFDCQPVPRRGRGTRGLTATAPLGIQLNKWNAGHVWANTPRASQTNSEEQTSARSVLFTGSPLWCLVPPECGLSCTDPVSQREGGEIDSYFIHSKAIVQFSFKASCLSSMAAKRKRETDKEEEKEGGRAGLLKIL